MSAADIARVLGDARREGSGWRCRCPLHGGRSLVLRDGQTRLLVTCWGGCNGIDVLVELRRSGLFGTRLPSSPEGSQSRRSMRQTENSRAAYALRHWNRARTALESPVVCYLAARGIFAPPPPSLRWEPRCWHPEAREYLPAMIASVERVGRGIVGIHRTYFTPEFRRRDRAALGPIGGGAVRLGRLRVDQWLALAEGIETALSVSVACALPAWAAISAGGLRNLILPSDARLVLICSDHDESGVGQRAARDAAQRFVAEGRRVRIITPPAAGADWNDVLLGKAPSDFAEADHAA